MAALFGCLYLKDKKEAGEESTVRDAETSAETGESEVKAEDTDEIAYYNASRCEAWVLTEKEICFYFNVGDAVPREEILIPFTSSETYLIEKCG